MGVTRAAFPIRLVGGIEYYVMPVHPNLIKKYGIEELRRNARLMGVEILEMTDEEMRHVRGEGQGDEEA